MATTVIIINCLFSGNFVVDNGYGGAIYNQETNSTIANCLFINNTTGDNGYGGAIWNDASNPDIINCTFVNNHAIAGGAICNNYSRPSIANCIIYGNTPDGITNLDHTNPESVNYSLLQDPGITGIGNLPPGTDPLFQDPENGNYQLKPCSPCINAGNNSYIPSGVTTDLIGNSRIFDRIVDMGAYEYQYLPTAVIAVQPVDISVMDGQEAVFSVTILPGLTAQYQWQYSIDGRTWINITGGMNSSLSFTATNDDNHILYHVLIISSCGNIAQNAISNAAKLTIT